MLYRVFPLLRAARHDQPGGALHVARERQGVGRHDSPEHYAVWYGSRSAESAVAEHLQAFGGREISDADFQRRDGRRYALATVDDRSLAGLIDLDAPRELVARGLRPSRVVTRIRAVTQPVARVIFEEGASGFEWWSTLEASWVNVTLFAERALPRLALHADPQPLRTDMPLVRHVAELLGAATESLPDPLATTGRDAGRARPSVPTVGEGGSSG